MRKRKGSGRRKSVGGEREAREMFFFKK